MRLFDTERYPIHQRDTASYAELVQKVKTALLRETCATLPKFVRLDALSAMTAEAESLTPQATFQQVSLNPYFLPAPDGAPDDHVLRRLSPRRHGMIRADRFDRRRAIWRAFQDPALCQFAADCLGRGELFPYADPYGAVNVNVRPPGCEFPWHFDTNDFTISIGLVQPGDGGVFEYVPNLRTGSDQNFDGTRAVLDGDRRGVRTLVLSPGDLQIFNGGYTLHRVTAPSRAQRLSLLLSYTTDADHVTTADQAIDFWGEAHELHHQADAARMAIMS